MMQVESNQKMIPRNYQVKLMEFAIKQNTILYLPTGAGKTFIAFLVIKHMIPILKKPRHDGGKLCFFLVNSVPLVGQHCKYLSDLLPLSIGEYTGDLNVDLWDRTIWEQQFNNHQVLVMTSQILLNILESAFLTLSDISLLIFDECHSAVNDHSMRSIMMKFRDCPIEQQPRVVGLTATIINGNCSPEQVETEVRKLETTFNATVCSVDEIAEVWNYSTNPKESLRYFTTLTLLNCQINVNVHLEELISTLQYLESVLRVKIPQTKLIPLEQDKPFKHMINMVKDVMLHIEMMGVFGGRLALIAHTILCQRLKKRCLNMQMTVVYDSIITAFTIAKHTFEMAMRDYESRDQIYRFSSPKVRELFEILKEYKRDNFCGIIFVQRRFTAKVLYSIVVKLIEIDQEVEYIKPEFIVRQGGRPNINTFENSYNAKMNKKALTRFRNHEINLMIASNLLEEGIDVPTCNLIVMFDKPTNYRSYVQSKGRARHKDSSFIILLNQIDDVDFNKSYRKFQFIETFLNQLLIGQSQNRLLPTSEELEDKYDEELLPPYFVSGTGSAQVTAISAISLLCRYCICLPSDKYTIHQPNWYITQDGIYYKVVIELPTICPIKTVEGKEMVTKKNAKRAAALEACIQLHKAKELNDLLLPNVLKVEEDLEVYFKHWPKVKDPLSGSNKKRRLHPKQKAKCLQGSIACNQPVYLHIIDWKPQFASSELTDGDLLVSELYTSDTCFGILTANKLPNICEFPLFLSMGEFRVNFQVNQNLIELTEDDLSKIRHFNVLVYKGVLNLLQSYLVIDNGNDAESMLLVPVSKSRKTIDFHILRTHKSLEERTQLSPKKRVKLEVSDETYYKKIVTPWYRCDEQSYVVTCVCTHLNAFSPFPSTNFKTFEEYFRTQYHTNVSLPDLPLLLVKGLTKNRQCLLPRGESKRRRVKDTSNEQIHFIPELCVKQDFPSTLWVQATFIPSCLHRIHKLLLADELRMRIEEEVGLPIRICSNWLPLLVNEHTMIKNEKEEKGEVDTTIDCIKPEEMKSYLNKINHDCALKKLDAEYPWLEKDEPVDIERNLNVTLTDIQDYENFISHKIESPQTNFLQTQTTTRLALEYDIAFAHKNIKLLTAHAHTGPELFEVYEALCTKKMNEIVNLERLETLGDCFLKFASSLYIYLKFSMFNEGKATVFKGALVSNKNLFYLGCSKGLHKYINHNAFDPTMEWKPPAFCVHKSIRERMINKQIPPTQLFDFILSEEEQSSGFLSREVREDVEKRTRAIKSSDESDDESLESIAAFFDLQNIPDKTIADCVEALIGLYFKSYGIDGALRFLEWLEVIPKEIGIRNIFNENVANPIINPLASLDVVDLHLPTWRELEKELGYHFKNRAYLLEALTHSSYTPNRITLSYERLEFLGDAILDFLITCYIYENCGKLNPGQLTDLRSALVNNVTFAGYTVRHSFQKHLLFCSDLLADSINTFVHYQKEKGFAITDDVQVLSEEDDMYFGEYADAPKVLGDVFEALAGAIFLDSGKSLEAVWKVIYRIMWKEIAAFSSNVPKNSVRLLYENTTAHAQFSKSVTTECGSIMVGLNFMLRGEKKRVLGFGKTKTMAKKAAAKMALRLL